MDITDPNAQALIVTVGFAHELITTPGTTAAEWRALTAVLVEEHTPEQLAEMLTGAAALLARSGPIL